MSLFEFKLPDLGEGVVEGEIVKWHVKAGDQVKEDEVVVEVMTDKATVTVPSPVAGKILKTYGAEGEIAKVHHRLADVELSGSAPAAAPAHGAPAAAAPAKTEAAAAKTAAPESNQKVLATPVTRRMASEHGLDLSTINGSGPQGRVLKTDVEAVLAGGASSAPAKAAPSFAPLAVSAADERIPLKGLRKRTARCMQRGFPPKVARPWRDLCGSHSTA